MKLFLKTIRLMVFNLLELLLPTKCLGCQTKGQIICPKCLWGIKRAEKEIDNKIIAVFQYHDPLIKKIILNLKYYHHPYLGQKLGEIVCDEILENISSLKIDSLNSPIWVIPVPMTKDKIRMRGYNQAKEIALGFCRRGKKDFFVLKNNIINKKFETIPQAKISNRRFRLKNVKNTFEIKKENLVKGQNIIVIDDITTTGGTINEIIKILEKAGAKKVIGLAVAH